MCHIQACVQHQKALLLVLCLYITQISSWLCKEKKVPKVNSVPLIISSRLQYATYFTMSCHYSNELGGVTCHATHLAQTYLALKTNAFKTILTYWISNLLLIQCTHLNMEQCEAFVVALCTLIFVISSIFFLQIAANRSYSCEDLGLRQIPEYLPSTTEVLDFSFNFLNTLQPSTFSKLEDLVSLDLTRYGRFYHCIDSHHWLDAAWIFIFRFQKPGVSLVAILPARSEKMCWKPLEAVVPVDWQ